MFKPIPVVIEPPADGTLPAAIGALVITNSTALEITGKVTADSGTAVLCRWFPELNQWRPWAEYAPMTLDSTKYNGCFSGRYKIAQTGPLYLVLLVSSDDLVLTAHGEGVVY